MLVSQGSDGTLDEQRVVFASFAVLWQLPTIVFAFQLELKRHFEVISALAAGNFLSRVCLDALLVCPWRVFPMAIDFHRSATDSTRLCICAAIFTIFWSVTPFTTNSKCG